MRLLYLMFAILVAWSSTSVSAAEDTIKIGTAISFTGKYSTIGFHTKNGYDFAVKKINDAGGVLVGGKTYKLKMVYYDDQSIPDRSAELVERLIKDDRVRFVLGPTTPNATVAVAQIVERFAIPMIVAGTSSRSLLSKGYKNAFAIQSLPERYFDSVITLAAQHALTIGKDPSAVRIAVAFENDPFSMEVRDGIEETAKRYGMNIVVNEMVSPDLADLERIILKAGNVEPDLLLVSASARGAAKATQAIGVMNINVPMIAMANCESANVTGQFGHVADAFFCPTQWSENLSYQDALFGTAAQYEASFKASNNEYTDKTVPSESAQASASIWVIKNAFEKAGSLDKNKVRDAVSATNLSTFYGQIRFSHAGNNIAKPMIVRQIQNGKYNVVAPSYWASHGVIWSRTLSAIDLIKERVVRVLYATDRNFTSDKKRVETFQLGSGSRTLKIERDAMALKRLTHRTWKLPSWAIHTTEMNRL